MISADSKSDMWRGFVHERRRLWPRAEQNFKKDDFGHWLSILPLLGRKDSGSSTEWEENYPNRGWWMLCVTQAYCVSKHVTEGRRDD